jgi:predicted transcriptional regulator
MMPPPQQLHQDISRTQHMTFEMIFSNFQTINQKLEKLSLLEQIAQKFNEFERKFNMLTNELKDVKHDLKQQSERRKLEKIISKVMCCVLLISWWSC